ncbi:carbohydrate porin [Acidiphilium sp.]|uniref:carbohydrate porin n=1 Tax=Acidiphilium sp. TaxID=527 RepID=UPI002583E0B0|nr:carbohydrate porin [Acidiphilium sp.]
MPNRVRAAALGLAVLTCLVPRPAAAQGSVWTRKHLFGDWGGVRSDLARRGVALGAVEQVVPSDVLGGGARQGTSVAALMTLSARVALGRYAGIPGLSAYVSAWLVQGRGPSGHDVQSLSGLAYEEAPGGARLGDAYLSWKAAHDAVHVKLGKFGIDENFDQNPAAAALVNSNFTYRNIMADNLPGGGPAFSYEGPGAMVAVQATRALRLRVGLFGGDPLGQPLEGPAPPARDAGGLGFPLNAGALVIGEADVRYRLPGLGRGMALVGGLYDTLSRPDLLYSVTGQSLALAAVGIDPGPARQDRGDDVIYAGDTQTLWHGARGRLLRGFARVAAAPPDRNLISLDAQAGLVLDGTFRGRPHDAAAVAVSWDRISPRAATLVRAENRLGGARAPVPGAETDLELDYTAQVAPWLSVTPDVQYIVRPGGGIPDPLDGAKAEPDAVVGQVEVTVVF